MINVLYILVGVIGGIVSGSFGIGGGTIMIPLLVFFFGLTQHQAQGTALATILAPVGILAVLRYYASGNVKVNIAIFMALGFILGAWLGAQFVHNVSDVHLKKVFGIFLVVVGLKMALFK